MIDKIQEAWALASHYHAGQRYATPTEGVTLPYLTHLGAVTLEAQEAARRDPALDAELMTLCAILHDSLEDTELAPEAIAEAFGARVLDGVRALTKDETLPTKQAQMADSLTRIIAQPREIAAVKLCDRICNMGPPPAHWPAGKRAAYRAEAELILKELGHASAYLADRLARKITPFPSPDRPPSPPDPCGKAV